MERCATVADSAHLWCTRIKSALSRYGIRGDRAGGANTFPRDFPQVDCWAFAGEWDLATEVQGSAVSGVGRGSRPRQQSDLNGVALDAS